MDHNLSSYPSRRASKAATHRYSSRPLRLSACGRWLQGPLATTNRARQVDPISNTDRFRRAYSRTTKISGSVRLSFQASDHVVYGPPSGGCHRSGCTLELLPLEPHTDAKNLRLR